ncbi:hypothetical protein KDY119_02805 [Luteimicrobium xylanilyticum]|uniref:Uncharacterized protein n=1 Tax=Luteimicrobium xylanilyticum TaxID=1133546 RepID=A0A5P9QCT2_9MICO|nr:hypothetical protein KDY119_02805 [Luteimicrobium xylanilyticum]
MFPWRATGARPLATLRPRATGGRQHRPRASWRQGPLHQASPANAPTPTCGQLVREDEPSRRNRLCRHRSPRFPPLPPRPAVRASRPPARLRRARDAHPCAPPRGRRTRLRRHPVVRFAWHSSRTEPPHRCARPPAGQSALLRCVVERLRGDGRHRRRRDPQRGAIGRAHVGDTSVTVGYERTSTTQHLEELRASAGDLLTRSALRREARHQHHAPPPLRLPDRRGGHSAVEAGLCHRQRHRPPVHVA